MLAEVAEFFKMIETQRGHILSTLEQMPVEAWNWTPTNDETNSAFVIATHVIGSEHGWIYEILGRGEKTRNRLAEFQAKATSLDTLRTEYERVANESRATLEGLIEQDLTTTRYRENHGDVTVRWILLHVIAHSSEHVGQLDLTKQLWEQSKKN